jgi:ABC-type transport system substrate-binding protein
MSRHPRPRLRPLAAVSVALVAALGALVVAAAPSLAQSATPSGKVDRSAVLRFGAPIEENGGVWFDPTGPGAAAQNPSARLWIDLIYDTMIHNTPDGKGEPGLATKWTAPDANTVELTLRQGVNFSDGAPFNAAAVKTAWDKLLASGRPNLTPTVKALQSVEAVNDNTIRIH